MAGKMEGSGQAAITQELAIDSWNLHQIERERERERERYSSTVPTTAAPDA
jgi:hypothetical protein